MATHSPQSRTPAPGVYIEVPRTHESAPSSVHAGAAAPARRPVEEATSGRVIRDPSPPETRTYHTRTIWSLLALSLLPGVVARAAPSLWLGLPDGWRWAIYGCSAVVLVAATILTVKPAAGRP